jgi:hypothetical protein
MHSRHYLFLLILTHLTLLLSGCHKAPTKKPAHKNKTDHLGTFLVEAKNSDIPIPVGCKARKTPQIKDKIAAPANSESSMLSYTSMLSLEALKIFYTENMERNGWNIVDFLNEEILFICTKRDRTCAIALRPLSKNKNSIVIFIKIRKDNSSTAEHKNHDRPFETIDEIELFNA